MNGTSTSIRPAVLADVARLVALNKEVHDRHVAYMPELFLPAPPQVVAAYFEEMLASEGARICVACVGEEVVGYVLLVLRERPGNPTMRSQRWLYIEQIGVSAAHRGQGHGAALIEAARAVARAEGLPRIELDTWGFNTPAHEFFFGQGFESRMLRMAQEV